MNFNNRPFKLLKSKKQTLNNSKNRYYLDKNNTGNNNTIVCKIWVIMFLDFDVSYVFFSSEFEIDLHF